MSPERPPRKPYFLRAIHEWIGDAGMTPQIIVDTSVGGVNVPPGYAQDDKMVLNISAQAVRELKMGNHSVEFTARFGGEVWSIHVPMGAVLGIYARESGEGLAFGDDDAPPPETPNPGDGPASQDRDGKRSHLKVVK